MEDFDFVKLFLKKLEEKTPNWYVKGIIDSDNNIITLGTDSKLIGRIFELKTNSLLQEIADEHEGYLLGKPGTQTEYPDFYYECPDGKRIAIDIKTTYLDVEDSEKKNLKKDIWYTLGSYKSFLQDGKKNISGTYDDYKLHYVIGFVYDRLKSSEDGQVIPYSADTLSEMKCTYGNVRVWVQEKYKITGLTEKSGNTTNIGSITSRSIDEFINGKGPFSALNKCICDDYWRNYKKKTTYKTVEEYFIWAKDNSELSIDFDEQKGLFEEWRRKNCPSKEDLLIMALKVLHAKGPKGGEKGLWAKFDDKEICVASKEPTVSEYIVFCNDNNIEVIDVIR